MQERGVYKAYRLHTMQLPSGGWVVIVVNFGGRKVITAESLTPEAIRIPGEFLSEGEAIHAARAYIDRQEAPEKEGKSQ